jgi:hypothetical protein
MSLAINEALPQEIWRPRDAAEREKPRVESTRGRKEFRVHRTKKSLLLNPGEVKGPFLHGIAEVHYVGL